MKIWVEVGRDFKKRIWPNFWGDEIFILCGDCFTGVYILIVKTNKIIHFKCINV